MQKDSVDLRKTGFWLVNLEFWGFGIKFLQKHICIWKTNRIFEFSQKSVNFGIFTKFVEARSTLRGQLHNWYLPCARGASPLPPNGQAWRGELARGDNAKFRRVSHTSSYAPNYYELMWARPGLWLWGDHDSGNVAPREGVFEVLFGILRAVVHAAGAFFP